MCISTLILCFRMSGKGSACSVTQKVTYSPSLATITFVGEKVRGRSWKTMQILLVQKTIPGNFINAVVFIETMVQKSKIGLYIHTYANRPHTENTYIYDDQKYLIIIMPIASHKHTQTTLLFQTSFIIIQLINFSQRTIRRTN